MATVARVGVSLEEDLLRKFDERIRTKKCPNRSEAIRALIREDLVRAEWSENKEIAGAITLIYDHHKRELVNRLVDIQHNFGEVIISSQHIHLDHDNCLEIVAVRGRPGKARELADTLKAVKGVKHATLSMATTGRNL